MPYNNRPFKRPRQSVKARTQQRYLGRRPVVVYNKSATYAQNMPEVKRHIQTGNDEVGEAVQGEVTTHLNAIALGTSNSQRIGNKITMVGVEVTYTVNCGSTINWVGAAGMRVALVYDAQPNGSTPAYSDVWQTGISGGFDSLAMRRTDNLDRFKILWDDQYVYPTSGSVGENDTCPKNRIKSHYVKLKGEQAEARFAESLSTNTTGALWLMSVFDQDSGTNICPALLYSSVVRYTDK